MKAEPVAQLELIGELVGRYGVLANHLRVRRELGIDREQRIEHHVAVVAGDVCGGPNRVENAQIRLRNKAQSLCCIRRPSAKTMGGERRRTGSSRELATRHPMSHS